ncbi:hypothetical protein DY000_02014943 [Brassica cretica]|uniref:Uncharacterized protein n=1 Tax=Brassica cretica TaxID=69181 RepID=A0ABQ7DDB7_BRACR|nr:hypothetical protein DY000_02014943 [Brassica cretica]
MWSKVQSINKFRLSIESVTNKLSEDVEAIVVDSDRGDDEDVNYISGSGFQSQRFGNQSGNINFNGADQRGDAQWCRSTPPLEHDTTPRAPIDTPLKNLWDLLRLQASIDTQKPLIDTRLPL